MSPLEVREQSAKLWTDLMESQQTEKKLRVERDKLKIELRRHRGEDLKGMSVGALEELEAEVKEGLARIHKQKEKVLREQADTERDQRLCVICQEKEKSTLLLPCRHLCLCKDCSRRSELDKCPLCRKGIDQKIDVFA